MQDYHQLDIWQRAMAYVADLYRFSAQAVRQTGNSLGS
jgi:hypothetical protein